MQSVKSNDKKKLRKYENTEVTLADDQHEDMCNIVKTIEEVSKDDLEKLFAEGDIHGVGDKSQRSLVYGLKASVRAIS